MNTWQIISVIVFSTMIYLSFQNSRSRKREQAWRERTFPEAEILGTAQGKEAEFLFGYGNMLVLRLSDGRKAYVRQSCVRCMIESKRPSESATSTKFLKEAEFLRS